MEENGLIPNAGFVSGAPGKNNKGEFRMSANKFFCKSFSKIVWQPSGEAAGAPQLDPNPMQEGQKAQACTGRQMGLVGPLPL